MIPAVGRAGIAGTYERATTNEAQIVEWWEGPYKGYNVAVVPGDSILVIDQDARHNGPKHWNELIQGHEAPNGLTVFTPTGGVHLYTGIGEDTVIRGRDSLLALGVDGWTGNRILLVPPSIHPLTGTPYFFRDGEPDWSLGRVLIPPAPIWLIEKIIAIERLPASARPGGRHQDLLFFALRARADNGLDTHELYEALKLYADYWGYDD